MSSEALIEQHQNAGFHTDLTLLDISVVPQLLGELALRFGRQLPQRGHVLQNHEVSLSFRQTGRKRSFRRHGKRCAARYEVRFAGECHLSASLPHDVVRQFLMIVLLGWEMPGQHGADALDDPDERPGVVACVKAGCQILRA